MKKAILSSTAIILITSILISLTAFAASQSDAEIGYRMKPLQDKLSAMTKEDIEKDISQFNDMKKHWSRMQIGKLLGLDIISKSTNGNFNPDSSLQADQYIKMLVRSMGFLVENDSKDWSKPYINLAIEKGIIKAGEIKEYSKPITRELMVKILIRAAMTFDKAPESKYNEYIIGKLKDFYKVSDNCKQSVLDSFNLGLITGSNGLFNPKGYLTRAEAAVILIRFIDKNERIPMHPKANEILHIKTNIGEPMELLPGAIPETYTMAKAMVDNQSKAKGYVTIGYNPDMDLVFAEFYESKEAWKADCISNSIGIIKIDYKHTNKYAFTLSVHDIDKYKAMFADYTRAVLMVMYSTEKGKAQAIALHDKYMNAKYTRTDGLNDYDYPTIDNRNTAFIRYNSIEFGIQAKFLGDKVKD